MKDTRNFDRAPLKDIRVKDNQIGIRTPQILISRKKGDYMKGDVLDANAVIQIFDELIGNVDNDHNSLEEIVGELHNLRDATDQGFEVFQEKAEEESANRIQGDKDLDDKIKTEKQERTNADTQLRNNLAALEQKVTANTAAINTKQPKGNYLTEHQSLEEYAKKTELPTVPTKVSELQNDSEFITKSVYNEKIAALEARITALEAKHQEAAA